MADQPPWEKYASPPQASSEDGPWAKYSTSSPAPSSEPGPYKSDLRKVPVVGPALGWLDENLVTPSIEQMGTGVEKILGRKQDPSQSRGANIASGVSDVARGFARGPGAPMALAGAGAAPLASAAAGAAGLVGGAGTQAITSGLGAQPGYAELAGTVTGTVLGSAAFRGAKTVQELLQSAQGNPALQRAITNLIPVYGHKINLIRDALQARGNEPLGVKTGPPGEILRSRIPQPPPPDDLPLSVKTGPPGERLRSKLPSVEDPPLAIKTGPPGQKLRSALPPVEDPALGVRTGPPGEILRSKLPTPEDPQLGYKGPPPPKPLPREDQPLGYKGPPPPAPKAPAEPRPEPVAKSMGKQISQAQGPPPTQGSAIVPPAEGVPERYNRTGQSAFERQRANAFQKDQAIANALRGKITPEQFDAADDAQLAAWQKSVNPKYSWRKDPQRRADLRALLFGEEGQ